MVCIYYHLSYTSFWTKHTHTVHYFQWCTRAWLLHKWTCYTSANLMKVKFPCA